MSQRGIRIRQDISRAAGVVSTGPQATSPEVIGRPEMSAPRSTPATARWQVAAIALGAAVIMSILVVSAYAAIGYVDSGLRY